MTEKPKEKIIKIYCKSCNKETNHKKEWEKKIREEINEGDMWLNTIYKTFSCMGCDEVTFRITTIWSEDIILLENNQYELEEKIIDYPKRDRRMIHSRISKNIYLLPPKIKRIFEETIEAYNNEQLILCAIGIRAIIEAVCLVENIEAQGLAKKIDALRYKGIITSTLKDGLNENRLIGNESAHRLEVFGEDELLTAINLIETLLENHYLMPSKIEDLKRKRGILLKNKEKKENV